MPGCTACLDPSGCSIEVYQGVGVKPHILMDMMQDNLDIRSAIQPPTTVQYFDGPALAGLSPFSQGGLVPVWQEWSMNVPTHSCWA